MKRSAGILFFRKKELQWEFFLVHPGGPYWVNKDSGSWSIPKGEYDSNETPLQAALREVMEETGITVQGDCIPLTLLKQKNGKLISAWAVLQDFDSRLIHSNLIELEWPPRSGKLKSFPEVDKGQWFSEKEAKIKLSIGQVPWIDELIQIITANPALQ